MLKLDKQSLERRAAALFDNDMVPDSTNEHNRKAWVASVLRLGNKWRAVPQPKLNHKEN